MTISRITKIISKGVSREFQNCFNNVSRMLLKSVKCVLRKFQTQSFKGISATFQFEQKKFESPKNFFPPIFFGSDGTRCAREMPDHSF